MINGKPTTSILVDRTIAADVAATQQALIGWDQILKGRFFKIWQQMQDAGDVPMLVRR
jgi:hypothetical protein